MLVAGWILRTVYSVCISPAFAVILSLLLVGLVISDVVPVILSISVFAAWLVAILAIAETRRGEPVTDHYARFLVVLATAALMALAANKYVAWCLVNYYKNHPAPSEQKGDADQLASRRLKELLRARIPKMCRFRAGEVARHETTSGSLIAARRGETDLLLMLVCNTETPAQKPKHWFGMIDATHMFTFPGKPDDFQPLPLLGQTWDDYVRKDTRTGPYSVLSESSSEIAKQHVKKGDVIVGLISTTCINCKTVRRYYVYFKMGEGGWYYEMPKGKEAMIPMPKGESVAENELEAFLDSQIPHKLRIDIPTKF